MKYMLDTNICISLLKHDPRAMHLFALKKEDGAAISAITLAELEFGVWNSAAFERNRLALLSFLPLVDVLPFDSGAALEYGKIRASLRKMGTPVGQMDMLIAAHAKSKGLIIVTNNTREFSHINGVEMENWI